MFLFHASLSYLQGMGPLHLQKLFVHEKIFELESHPTALFKEMCHIPTFLRGQILACVFKKHSNLRDNYLYPWALIEELSQSLDHPRGTIRILGPFRRLYISSDHPIGII